MCLIVFDWRPGETTPLRLAANRDEAHERPAAALHAWKEAPSLVGGRDLRAGGTWLAAHDRGRLAAVTNVRDPACVAPADAPSRGELVRQALECADPVSWLRELADRQAAHYAGFNLLVCDGATLWHLHHGRQGTRLEQVAPGVHGISNASLDTPWPKLLRSRAALASTPDTGDEVFGSAAWSLLLNDERPADEQLPDTGVGIELERFLAPPFIVGERYGTRASTWVIWHARGEMALGERSFGPHGRFLEERRRQLTVPRLPLAV